jgi:hypothetical protein
MPGAEAGHEVSQLALGRLKICGRVLAALVHNILQLVEILAGAVGKLSLDKFW